MNRMSTLSWTDICRIRHGDPGRTAWLVPSLLARRRPCSHCSRWLSPGNLSSSIPTVILCCTCLIRRRWLRRGEDGYRRTRIETWTHAMQSFNHSRQVPIISLHFSADFYYYTRRCNHVHRATYKTIIEVLVMGKDVALNLGGARLAAEGVFAVSIFILILSKRG